jgi:sulfite reductase (NADPH) hemoprotein beta-component
MSEMNHPQALGSTRLGFADEGELDRFVEKLEAFERGEVAPDAWRAFRLVHGVYGQRQDGPMMVRCKIPQGVLTPEQLLALAEVSERWSNGKGHITTRQNVQFHFVKMEDVEAVVRRLGAAGLTTREACGNSVRNITGCPYAGVSEQEPFDVTPYAEAMTRHLLRGPLSSTLPRKFKIAFGGCCGGDCVGGGFHDIGFLARVRDGKRGFRVTIGGGLSTLRRAGFLAHEFLPVEQIFDVAEAVLRVFDRTGDRKNKAKARLKFVIERLGVEGFLSEYRKESEAIAAQGGRPLGELPPVAIPRLKRAFPQPAGPGFDAFLDKNVRAQKQRGQVAVTVRVTLGDLSTAQLRGLAQIAKEMSAEEQLRTTAEQNLVIRFIAREALPALHARLQSLGLALAGPRTIGDVTSCPGAMSCKLAVTQSRGLADLLSHHLEEHPEVAALAETLSIKVSGCPNGCGQHYVAGIGFQGSVRKIAGRAVPQYHVFLGGKFDGTSFGRLAVKVPARRAPQVLTRLLELYASEKKPGETPDDFFARVPLPQVHALLADLTEMSQSEATPDDFIDLGEKQSFEVVLQEGECAA